MTDRHDAPDVTDDARGDSPLDAFGDQQTGRRRRTVVLGSVAAVLLLLAVAYVGALWALADRVPVGTTVAGVEIGGLDAPDAVERLRTELGPAATQPVPVSAGERRTALDPAAAGLALDAEQTVASVTGFGLEPGRLVRHVTGGDEIDPATTVDDAALEAALTAAGESLTTSPVDGSVVYVDARPEATAAVPGTVVDLDAARATVVDGWLTGPFPLDLPTEEAQPTIDDDEVERVLAEVARPFADAPVVVAVADQRAELPVEVLTAAASFVPEGDRLELRLDGELLRQEVLARTTGLVTDAADARFEFRDGAPVIVPAAPGTTLDPAVLADAVAAAGLGPDGTARVELVEIDPERSTADLEALGVTDRVSHFATNLTANRDRTHNIVLAAERLDGTLLRPGDVLSLTGTVGPITAANGYRQAGTVVDGVLVQGTGGGLSQMGTTVYNAGFFAGLEDVEHRPHSYYFPRYPEGREATIYDGVIDVKIGNNTPYGVLFQSWVADGQVHVATWSTPYWTVEHSTSPRSDVVPPTTVHSTSPDCVPQDAGSPGFRVTVVRRLLLDGRVEHEESQSWRYQPQNAVVCGPA